MGVFDRLAFRSRTDAPSAVSYGYGGLARRVDFDTRTLIPGQYDGGGSARAWDRLSPEAALCYPAWYRAVIILSTAMRGMRIDLKRVEDEDGGTKFIPGKDHAAFWPLCIQANDEETAASFRGRMTYIMCQYGSAYARIVRRSGKPIQLIPYCPYECWPEREGGKKVFKVEPNRVDWDAPIDEKRVRTLSPDDVFEMALPSLDGYYPEEPYRVGRMTLYAGLAGERVRAARAINSGRPRIALTTEKSLNDTTIKRIRAEFPAFHSGEDDRIVPAVLDQDLKIQSIPYQPEYAAEVELNNINTRDVSNLTGVPATFLGDADGRSYNSLEADLAYFYEFGLGIYLDSFEDQAAAKMLDPGERRNRSIDISFDRQTTKFADTKTMGELIRALGAGAPIARINEIRAKFGMSALEDEEAKKLYFPKNMGTGGENNQGGDNPPGNPGKSASAQIPHEIPANERLPAGSRGLATTKMIARKIATRAGKEAGRKAGDGRAYMAFAGGEFETTYLQAVTADFAALKEDFAGWENREPAAVAATWLAEGRAALLALAECKPGELDAKVNAAIPAFVDTMTGRLPALLAE